MLLQFMIGSYAMCVLHLILHDILYLRSMVTAAWSWAQARNLIRRNEVHGEEEVRLILSDNFSLLDETTNETSMSGRFEVEDCSSTPFMYELCTHIDLYVFNNTYRYRY